MPSCAIQQIAGHEHSTIANADTGSSLNTAKNGLAALNARAVRYESDGILSLTASLESQVPGIVLIYHSWL